MTRTRIIRTMKDTRNRRGWMVMGWLWLGLLTARAGLACSPTITCLDCQTGENGLLLVATGQAATFRVYPTYCGVLNTDWLVDGVTESSVTGIQYKFIRTFSAATPAGQPHTVRAVITNDDSGTAISVGSNTLSVTVTANAFTVNIVPSAGCTVTAGDGGVDAAEANGNGIVCAGATAANDPLCTEQFKNNALATLKVTTEPGYGFNGWIVDGGLIKMTQAEPLFLTTMPRLADAKHTVFSNHSSVECQTDCVKQTVYLTFDDGPVPGTDDVIRILQQEKIKGSFFMTGIHISSPQREGWVKDAHINFELGNHSYSHPWKHSDLQIFYAETANAAQHVADDFQQNDSILSTVAGITKQFTLSRLPTKNTWRISGIIKTDKSGGEYPPGEMAVNLLQQYGYHIYGWDANALWEDDNGTPVQSPQLMVNKVKTLFKKGAIKNNKVVVLMHDRMFRASSGTDVQLEEFIRLLKQEGYEFDYISNY